MSIKAYVGRMGSGKSYEVVASVIVPALARGRRVVSNIAGLDIHAIRELLLEDGIEPDKIGELVQIDHSMVMLHSFWRSDKPYEESKPEPDRKTFRAWSGGPKIAVDIETAAEAPALDWFIQPGDLIALDEIWRFWSGFSTSGDDGTKRPNSVMNFFRMHRHFTHATTGVSCDVALITQDVMDISRQVRSVIEETYYMEKLTAIGSSKRYRVDIHQGGKIARKPLRSIQRSYESRYFPLYSSHSQKKEGDAVAVEENIDKRGNILSGALFKVVLPLGAVMMLGAVYLVWGFFHPKPKTEPIAKNSDAKGQTAKPGEPAQVSHAKPKSDLSETWRVVGHYQTGGTVALLLTNGTRTRLLQNPPGYKIQGGDIEAALPEGEMVATWTGSTASGLLPGSK